MGGIVIIVYTIIDVIYIGLFPCILYGIRIIRIIVFN